MRIYLRQLVPPIVSLIFYCTCARATKPRVARCCKDHQFIQTINIDEYDDILNCKDVRRNRTTDFSEVVIYTEQLQPTNMTVMETFDVVDASEMNIDLNETENYSHVMVSNNKSFYLTEVSFVVSQ